MNTQQYIKLARYSFTISFAIGTLLILILFTYPMNIGAKYNLMRLGLFCILIATIYNSIVFIGICIMAIIRKKNQKTILLNACIMLLNIPIAFIYAVIVISNFLN
jgi:hypothetical protein